jgi:dTDP-4-amino-4,6-dideoxygalactose transaminase
VTANDFSRQWGEIGEDVLAAVDRVGASGRLILGQELEAFERDLASWWGVRYAVGVASGLDALEIALRCAGVGPGNRVVTTPLTAFATTLAVVRAGADPVWCDIDESGGLDLDAVDLALRSDRSIKAIVPVHLYGHPLDPAALERLAADHGVAIVEDCAQSAGAWRGGRPTGSVGIASGVSLYPTKNLGAMGDGGVVLTGDFDVAERVRRMRHYGQLAQNEHVELGLNSRLDELQAAVLRSAHLPRLDGWLKRRRAIAERYLVGLSGCSLRPVGAAGGSSAHHLFPVEVMEGSPTAVARGLGDRNILVGRHYPSLCPDQVAIGGRGTTIGSLPVARRLAERELSLPIHPYLYDEEVDWVIEACLEVSDG